MILEVNLLCKFAKELYKQVGRWIFIITHHIYDSDFKYFNLWPPF